MNYGKDRQVKLYWSISEVCALTGIEKHILRYWENEFPQLHPRKNRAGNRIYRERDIEIIRSIQYLLHTEKFTIEGARQRLRSLDTAQIIAIAPGQTNPELAASDTADADFSAVPSQVASTAAPVTNEGGAKKGLHQLPAERRRQILSELQAIRGLLDS